MKACTQTHKHSQLSAGLRPLRIAAKNQLPGPSTICSWSPPLWRCLHRTRWAGVAVCGGGLQCVAVCCSVLQCVSECDLPGCMHDMEITIHWARCSSVSQFIPVCYIMDAMPLFTARCKRFLCMYVGFLQDVCYDGPRSAWFHRYTHKYWHSAYLSA